MIFGNPVKGSLDPPEGDVTHRLRSTVLKALTGLAYGDFAVGMSMLLSRFQPYRQ